MTNKAPLITTVTEATEAFGGVKGMCAIFGGVPGRFYNYMAAGRFPEYMHMRVYVEAKARGINLAPELIGMTRPGETAKPELAGRFGSEDEKRRGSADAHAA